MQGLVQGPHYFRPVARGVQTGAIAPPTGCKVRLAGYEYYSLYCAIYTYINSLRTAMCMSACKSTGMGSNQGCSSRSGIRAMARPFLPKVHLEKGYTDKNVCIYPVWIIIYHI